MTAIADMDLERIGFAGLGLMGGPMAERLLTQGHDLLVWNRSAAKAEALAEKGAAVAKSPVELSERDVVVLMLLDGPACSAVLSGENGILTGPRTPRIVVNMSTIDTMSALELRNACAEVGVAYISAPVSGSTLFARNGNLTIIVSGDRPSFDAVAPLLQDMGSQVLHVGEQVESSLIKLCTVLVIGALNSAIMEAVALIEKGGVDLGTYLGVLNESVVGCAYTRYKTEGLTQGNFTPGHSLRGLNKDYGLIEATAGALGVSAPVTSLVRQQIRAAVGRDEGDLDMTGLLRQVRKDAGL